MVLSAIAVVYISTPESQEAYQASFSNSYTVYDTSDNSDENTDSNSTKLGKSFVNAFVIVSVICIATFIIVLLYKYKYMKILWGYMIIANTMLLIFVSGSMLTVAIERYELYGINKISFYTLIYNISIVGTLSIFGGNIIGIPIYITQMYLIYISILTAWLLSNFDSWTAWSLLIMLALYDLFAVLTPCGPLKALVNLMIQDDAPDMPGLLYEAGLAYDTVVYNSYNINNIRNNNNINTTTTDEGTSAETNPESEEQTSSATSPTNNRNQEGVQSSPTSENVANNGTRSSQSVYLSHGLSVGNIIVQEQVRTSSSRSLTLHNKQKQNDEEEEQNLLLLLTSESDSVSESNSKEHRDIHIYSDEASSISSSGSQYQSRRLTEKRDVANNNTLGRSIQENNRVEIILENPYLSTRVEESKYDVDDEEEAEAMIGRRSSQQELVISNNQNERSTPSSLPISSLSNRRIGSIPYAIAKLYRLPTMNDPQPPWIITQRRNDQQNPVVLRPAQVISEQFNDEESVVSTNYVDPTGDEENVNNNNNIDDTASVATVSFTIEQLTSLIDVVFPANGGYIEKTPIQNAFDGETRWQIIDREGSLKRILFVKNENGKIYEDLQYGKPNNNDESRTNNKRKERNSIRLGLGDFIFYSVLVSKAALYSYTTFVSCTIAIITGLGLTLLILAAIGKALPALPISILLGVLFYIQTRYVTQPWIEQIIFINQQQTMYV